jgi:hypothetical protein
LPEPADGWDGPPLPLPRKLDGSEGMGGRANPASAEPAVLWQDAKKPSLIDAVEFRAPVPLAPPR